ncbi:MAG: hypothetical protein FWD69_04495 [Polyangiaceae bacterium]|nr:hypothetical protein [Polyangiaceae bacterium]
MKESVVTSSESAPGSRARVLSTLEYVLQLAFFAAVPFVVVVLASLVPMIGAIANIVLALVTFFFGEVLRTHAQRRGWVGRVLRRQLAFEAYYREKAPKPFLYYVFYPLLFPYWLTVREARREAWLFKGYTIVTFIVLAIAGVYRYFTAYRPELGLRPFLVAFGVGVVVETVAVLMLLMPMTTSIVAHHQKKQRRHLFALLAVGLVSAAIAATMLARRHRSFPSLETRERVLQRTLAVPARAKKAQMDALSVAWKARKEKRWGREDDGTLAGPALDDARAALNEFYRPDEANAFELWTSARKEKPMLMVIFAEGPRKGRPVFLGMQPDGTLVERVRDIPKPARVVMRTAGDL